MRVELGSVRTKWLFLIFVISLSGGLFFLAGKVWLAEHWNASAKPDLWLRAAHLEPDNARYWQQMGVYKLRTLEHQDLHQAVFYLRQAAKINPRSDRIWMEMASAYEMLSDPTQARRAYQKAQASHPDSAEVAWRYGSFLIRRRDFSAGFAQIQRALVTEPSLTASAISECWEADPDISAILDEALPAGNGYSFTVMNVFLSQSQTNPALAVWRRLLQRRQPFPLAQAMPLIDNLIGQNRIGEAEKTWKQALAATDWPQDKNDSGSLVFNGGFEHTLANGGFDWREIPVRGASFDLDRAIVHAGQQSLRIEFDGSANLDFQHLLQYVPVQPKHRYHFSAYLRTEGITTDSGVRFSIYDPRHPSEVQILTPNLVGTNPWTLVETDVATGADTDLLVIALRRIPSWKFDNKLAGTVWVDDVSFVPMANQAKGNKQ